MQSQVVIRGYFPILLSTRLLSIDMLCPENFWNPKSGTPAERLESWGPPVELPWDTISHPPAKVFTTIYQPRHVPLQIRASAKLTQGHTTSESLSNMPKSYMPSSFHSKGQLQLALSDLLLNLMSLIWGNDPVFRVGGRFCCLAA